MLEWLLELGTRYGYVVVFLGVMVESMGIPIPGETALLVGAVLAGTGHLNLLVVAGLGWMGAVIGDNIGYSVGRRCGQRLLAMPRLRRIYKPEHVATAEAFFARHGWTAVFFGRFVALLRIFAGPLAGMHRMPWGRFFIANAAGGGVWVATVCIVGLLVGQNLDAADRLLGRTGYGGLALVVLVGVVWIGRGMWRRHRAEKKGPPPKGRPTEPD